MAPGSSSDLREPRSESRLMRRRSLFPVRPASSSGASPDDEVGSSSACGGGSGGSGGSPGSSSSSSSSGGDNNSCVSSSYLDRRAGDGVRTRALSLESHFTIDEMDAGKSSALLAWVNALKLGQSVKSMRDFCDGKVLLQILRACSIEPGQVAISGIDTALGRMCVVEDFLQAFYQVRMVDKLNLEAVMENGDEFEVGKALMLMFGAAVQSANRQHFVQLAMTLSNNQQSEIKDIIEPLLMKEGITSPSVPENYSDVLKTKLSVSPSSSRPPVARNLYTESPMCAVRLSEAFESPLTPIKAIVQSPQMACKLRLRDTERRIRELDATVTEERHLRMELEWQVQDKQEKLTGLETRLAEADRKLSEMNALKDTLDEIAVLKSDNHKYQTENDRLKTKLSDRAQLKANISLLTKENEELLQKIFNLQDQLKNQAKLKESLASREQRLAVVEDRQANVERLLEEKQQTVATLNENLRELQRELESTRVAHRQNLQEAEERFGLRALDSPVGESMSCFTRKQIDELQTEISALLDQQAALGSELESSRSLLERVEQERHALSADKTDLANALEAANLALDDSETKMNNLALQIGQLNAELVESKTARSELQFALYDEQEAREQDVAKLKRDMAKKAAEFDAEVNDYKKSIDELREEWSAKKADMEQCFEAKVKQLQDQQTQISELNSKLIEKMNVLSEKNQGFHRKLQDSEQKFNSYKNELLLRDENISDLEKVAAENNSIIVSCRAEIETLKKELESSRKQLSCLEMCEQQSKVTIMELEAVKATLNQEVKCNEQEVSSLKGVICDLQEDLERLQSKVIKCQEDISMKDNEICILNETCSSLKITVGEQVQTISLMESSAGQLRCDIDARDEELHAKIETINELVGQLQNEKERQDSYATKCRLFETELTSMDEERGNLRLSIVDLESKLQKRDEVITDLETHRNQMKEQLDERGEEIARLEYLRLQAQHEKDTILSEQSIAVDDWNKQLAAMASELENLKCIHKEQLEVSEKKVDEMRIEVTDAEGKHNDQIEVFRTALESANAECQRLIAEGESNKERFEDEMKHMKVMMATVEESLELEKQVLRSKIDELETNNQEVRDQLLTVSVANQTVTREYELLKETHVAEIAGLKTEINSINKDINIRNSRLAEQDSKIVDFEAQLASSKEEISRLTEKCNCLYLELDAEKENKFNLISACAEKEERLTSESAKFSDEATKLVEDLNLVRHELESLKNVHAALVETKSAQESELAELKQSVDRVEERLLSSGTDLAALNDVHADLLSEKLQLESELLKQKLSANCAEAALSALRDDYVHLQEEKQVLNVRVENESKALADARTMLSDTTRQMEDERTECLRITKETELTITELNLQVRKLESDLSSNAALCERHLAESERLKASTAERVSTIADLEEKLQSMTADVDEKSAAMLQVQQLVTDKDTEMERLRSLVEHKDKTLNQYSADHKSLNECLSEALQELKGHQNDSREKGDELVSLRETCDAMLIELNERDNEITNLKCSVNESEKKFEEELSKKDGEIVNLKQTCDTLQNSLTQWLETVKVKMDVEIQELEKYGEERDKEVSDLKCKLAENDNKVSDLLERCGVLTQTNTEQVTTISDLESRQLALHHEVEQRESQIAEHLTSISNLRSSVDALQSRSLELESTVRDRNDELEKISGELTAKCEELSALTSSKAEVVIGMNAQLEKANGHLQDVQADNIKLQNRLADAGEQIAMLEYERIQMENEKNTKIAKQAEMITALEDGVQHLERKHMDTRTELNEVQERLDMRLAEAEQYDLRITSDQDVIDGLQNIIGALTDDKNDLCAKNDAKDEVIRSLKSDLTGVQADSKLLEQKLLKEQERARSSEARNKVLKSALTSKIKTEQADESSALIDQLRRELDVESKVKEKLLFTFQKEESEKKVVESKLEKLKVKNLELEQEVRTLQTELKYAKILSGHHDVIVKQPTPSPPLRVRRSTRHSLDDSLESGHEITPFASSPTSLSETRRNSVGELKISHLQDEEFAPAASVFGGTEAAISRFRHPSAASSLYSSQHSIASDLSRASNQMQAHIGTLFSCEDEPEDFQWNRLSELQRRNTLCLPHMKSSYPVETQANNPREMAEELIASARGTGNKYELAMKRLTVSGSGGDIGDELLKSGGDQQARDHHFIRPSSSYASCHRTVPAEIRNSRAGVSQSQDFSRTRPKEEVNIVSVATPSKGFKTPKSKKAKTPRSASTGRKKAARKLEADSSDTENELSNRRESIRFEIPFSGNKSKRIGLGFGRKKDKETKEKNEAPKAITKKELTKESPKFFRKPLNARNFLLFGNN